MDDAAQHPPPDSDPVLPVDDHSTPLSEIPFAAEPPPAPIVPARPMPRWPHVVIWFLLLACTTTIFGMRLMTHRYLTHEAPITASEPEQTDIRFDAMSRYIVGVNVMMRTFGQTSTKQSTQDLIDEIDAIADTRVARIRVISIVGELAGKREALDRIEQMLEEPFFLENDYHDLEALRVIYTHGTHRLDESARKRLLRRHQWHANLALSHDLTPNDPMRQKVVAAGVRTLVGVLGMLGLFALAALLGMVLLAIGIALVCVGTIRAQYVPHFTNTPHIVFIESVVLCLLLLAIISVVEWWSAVSGTQGSDLEWVGLMILGLMVLTPLWPLVRGVPWSQFQQAMGWHRGRGLLRETGAGIIGYIAGVPLMIFGLIITVVLSMLFNTQASHNIVEDVGSTSWVGLLVMFSLLCVWAPVVEESIFRGAFYHYLRSRRHWIITSSLITAFIFAIIHPQGFVAVPTLMSLAIVFAMLREWRGSIIAAMVAHALNNFAIGLLLVLMLG